jgi:hypothetical protein
MDASQKEWENKPVNSWEGPDWQGFFMHLEMKIKLTNWNYVNNQTGGFWCAVLNWDYCFGMPIYAQIEGQRICVKLALDDPLKPNPFSTDPKDLRNKISDIFRARANAKGLNMFRKQIQLRIATIRKFSTLLPVMVSERSTTCFSMHVGGRR